jgi:hypothetical protein
VIRAVGKTALAMMWPHKNGVSAARPTSPGPEFSAVLPPRPADLVRDYIRHVGGDPAAYRNTLPPHLFPQWTFPLAARTLEGIPYPMAKVLNGGCRLEIHAPLPADEPLHVSARLENIDDDGRRAVLEQRIVTGTKKTPVALVAHLYAIVPLARDKTKKDKPRPRVPQPARELAFWKLRANAGLEFAVLTGDVNPVHWVPAYARQMGFRNTILHGFATMARAIEGLQTTVFSGSTRALETFEVRFTRPLVLPARVGLYVVEKRVYVGDAPGGGAYLEGSFTTVANGAQR